MKINLTFDVKTLDSATLRTIESITKTVEDAILSHTGKTVVSDMYRDNAIIQLTVSTEVERKNSYASDY